MEGKGFHLATIFICNNLRLLADDDRLLEKRIREVVADVVAHPDSPNIASRSIMHLALKNQELTPSVLEEASHQVRSFLFAGYDTTSTAIQWMVYYLSLPSNSAVVDALIAEHDHVLGPVENRDQINAKLLTDPVMPMTDAFIKETLRLQPPGASARWVPPSPEDKPFYITTSDGKTHQINDSPLYICHKIIHTTTKIWGPDAKDFRPSRWLDKEYVASLPPGAFRPFERGPRDCIGQGLAYMEAKIALSLIARQFVFQKYTPQDEMSDLGDVWNAYRMTPVPNDGMRMTVKKRYTIL
jgi:cytochrome P450